MRAQLLHLSGPYRGRTITYDRPDLVFGSGSDADVRFRLNGIESRHAELVFKEAGRAFHFKALDGDVFVNHRSIQEVILEPGDLLEIGKGGPRLRFRVERDTGRTSKPVRQMLHDARDVGSASGVYMLTQTFARDLVTHATWKLKVGVPLAAVILGFTASYLGGHLRSQKAAEDQEALRRKQAERFDTALAEMGETLEEYRERERVSHGEIGRLQKELAEATSILDEIESRDSALKQVLEHYSRGVCLIHGVFTMQVERYGELQPLRTGKGKRLLIEYIGSGFLVSEQGHVATNRHVAEPWWNNERVKPFLDAGMTPAMVRLEASFPGRPPKEVDLDTIRISTDDVDVAMFQVELEGVPVLPLHEEDISKFRGEKVIVLGYPTGINALMARAEPSVAAEILKKATDTRTLIRELAQHKAISPIITQGALNEVKERRLVYDADTTSGGSGGPVFGPDGRVIGINFAIVRDFTGSNFGIPIAFVKAMLD